MKLRVREYRDWTEDYPKVIFCLNITVVTRTRLMKGKFYHTCLDEMAHWWPRPERLKGLYRAATAPQQAISLQDKVFGIMGKLVNLWHIRFSWMTHFMIFIQIVPARNFKIRIKREHSLLYNFMFSFRATLYAITLTRFPPKKKKCDGHRKTGLGGLLPLQSGADFCWKARWKTSMVSVLTFEY